MARWVTHRIDATQQAIFDTLEKGGMTVIRGGPLDGIGGLNGHNILIECKTKKGKLRPSQQKLIENHEGAIAVLRSPEDAIQLLQMLRAEYWPIAKRFGNT